MGVGPRDPKTPVKGVLPRIKNLLVQHHKGLFGVIVPLVVLPWQPQKGLHDITVMCMWFWMFWFFLLQPVNIPVVGLVPVFLLPMAGVTSSADVCSCYFNENIALFILSGMVLLLLNMSGIDRRIILWLLCSGDNCQFSGKRIVFKSSVAAFVMSMFSNRLIITSTITQYLTPAYVNLQSYTSRYRATEPDYDTMRHIVLNAVQTSSAIGSTAILHSAYTTVAMRAMFSEQDKSLVFPDIYNFLQYSFFAFPTAFLMFILNMCYHMLLINCVIGRPMSASSMTEFRSSLLKQKSNIPKAVSRHEKMSLLFSILYLAALFFRWSRYRGASWSKFRTIPNFDDFPMIHDATVAAIFVLAIHVIPKTCGWAKILQADKKSQCGSLKPDSAVMWWRFVDKNTNYGYIILLGSGIALVRAIKDTKGSSKCYDFFNGIQSIVNTSMKKHIALIAFLAVVAPNIMTGVAGLISLLPLIINIRTEEGTAAWDTHKYSAILAAGMGTSYGFMMPFLYTPAYFCHFTGKVPKKKMILYSIGSVIICGIILWAACCFWAPVIFSPVEKGHDGVTITAGGGGGGGGGEGGGGEGGEPEPEP
ncbi:unnamed protein product [Leptosia nina]|uniref:Citrate transporter-like domain-containing protein n=1 Tax=Leptosia nina TaxID=320188 RepID=A0AAV1JF29_9NEOP